MSADQLLENERINCAPEAARHGSVGTVAWWQRHASPQAAPACFARLLPVRHALPGWRRCHASPGTRQGRNGTPCPAAHALHGGEATSTERADRSDYNPTCIYFLSDQRLKYGQGDYIQGPDSEAVGDVSCQPCAGAWMARLAPWRQRYASHGFMLAATLGLVGRPVARKRADKLCAGDAATRHGSVGVWSCRPLSRHGAC